MKPHRPQDRALDFRAALAAFVATMLALPVNAATSFPDYPLQTGVGSVPPNILFLLDDSTSMTRDYMPDGLDGDEFYTRNINFNQIAYDPSIDYEPWVDENGSPVSGGQSYASSVYRDGQRLADEGGLRFNREQLFYVPKSGSVPNRSRNYADYYQYSIGRNSLGQPTIFRCEETQRDGEFFGECSQALPSATRSLEKELSNYATWYSFHRTRMKIAKAGASEAFAGLGTNFRVGYNTIHDDRDMTDAANTIIPVADGSDQFHGSVKQAWFDLLQGEQIPSSTTDFTPLRTALVAAGEYYKRTDANGPWGPQAGDDQLACRPNFTILTTDGYWNKQDEGEAASAVRSILADIGNEDGTAGPNGYVAVPPYADDHSKTLADIAMHYWKNDLREDMENEVPSVDGGADWQHMVTFGISIGLQGTLSQLPTTRSGEDSWPDPDPGSSSGVQEGIDDLWHAAVNGHGTFVAATNANTFAQALKDALGSIPERPASGSNVTSNGPQLQAGSRIFQATFTSGAWSGDVKSIALDEVSGGIESSAWSVAAVANNPDNPSDPDDSFLERPVYTWGGTDGAEFPTAAQKLKLGSTPEIADDNVAYIKGDRSKEGDGPGDLRQRTTPIGDIVNSSPFYSEEAAALFIGANDGMLHAINSASGVVEFSYVPAGLDFPALATLSDPDYQHRFFVDGGIDVTTRAQGGGRNILVASLGRGGKGVFALDVTDPATFDATDVLWDKTFNAGASGDADMGYVLGAPLVRKGHTDTTLAFVGNGVDSANGSSTLFIYNATTGALVRKIVLDADGGGLAPPRAADTNLDGIADFLYAGDLSGNLWKLDIQDKNASKWSGEKFFTAIGPDGVQPITAAVSIAREPVTERIFVMFGTGKYVSNGDLADVSTQTLYALIDEGTAITGRDELHERTIPFTGKDSQDRNARAWESYSALPADAKGWYVDLGIPTAGERVVTAPFMRGRALWFSSIIPQAEAGCGSGGTGYLNALDGFTGTNPKLGGGTGTYIDVDGDGEGDDKLEGAPGDDEEQFITSVDLGVGMVGQGTGVGNTIYACGSEAECGLVDTLSDGSGAKRLGWRELYNRN